MIKVFCPICWHEETWRAIRQQTEPVRDDMPRMRWNHPQGGARGQVVTMWDGGHWRCEICRMALPAHVAAILIDAVLRVSDPDSDSYVERENTFADAIAAAKGEVAE